MTDAAVQYDIFLSHNSADKPAVETLAQQLLAAGIRPWLDSWNLVPGDPWQEGLEEALDTCATCAVFLGPSGIGPWHNEELRVALDRRARDRTRRFRVIPVLLPGANPADPATLPRFLGRMTWVDFWGGLDDAEAFRRLVAGIRGVAPGPGIASRPESSLRANETVDGHLRRQRQPKEARMPLSASQIIDLETRYRELDRQYHTLTDHIAALDTDIGRELDSERKLVLNDRRNTAMAERKIVADKVHEIENRLGRSRPRSPMNGAIPYSKSGYLYSERFVADLVDYQDLSLLKDKDGFILYSEALRPDYYVGQKLKVPCRRHGTDYEREFPYHQFIDFIHNPKTTITIVGDIAGHSLRRDINRLTAEALNLFLAKKPETKIHPPVLRMVYLKKLEEENSYQWA